METLLLNEYDSFFSKVEKLLLDNSEYTSFDNAYERVKNEFTEFLKVINKIVVNQEEQESQIRLECKEDLESSKKEIAELESWLSIKMQSLEDRSDFKREALKKQKVFASAVNSVTPLIDKIIEDFVSLEPKKR